MVENNERLCGYLNGVVDSVFKILPLYEEKNTGIELYVESLLKGLFELDKVIKIEHSFEYISLLTIVKAVQTEVTSEESQKKIVKREVFNSINTIKKLISKIEESE